MVIVGRKENKLCVVGDCFNDLLSSELELNQSLHQTVVGMYRNTLIYYRHIPNLVQLGVWDTVDPRVMTIAYACKVDLDNNFFLSKHACIDAEYLLKSDLQKSQIVSKALFELGYT